MFQIGPQNNLLTPGQCSVLSPDQHHRIFTDFSIFISGGGWAECGQSVLWCGEAPDDRIIEKLSYNNDDEAALLHHIIEQLSNMETHVISTSPGQTF